MVHAKLKKKAWGCKFFLNYCLLGLLLHNEHRGSPYVQVFAHCRLALCQLGTSKSHLKGGKIVRLGCRQACRALS